jgi:hypothetical protein
MIASKRDWRRLRKPYDAMSYKRIRRYAPERQPCSKVHVQVMGKRGKPVTVSLDCPCKACKAYEIALQHCNEKPVITPLGFVPASK